MLLSKFGSGTADLPYDDRVKIFAEFTFLSLFCMCLYVQGCVSLVSFLDIPRDVLPESYCVFC